MKCLLILLLVCLSISHVQANGDYMCHALEDSDLTRHIDLKRHKNVDLNTQIQLHTNFAVSDDQRLIALYQNSTARAQAVFKLFDSQTGKLIQSKLVKNYEERSSQTALRFSPQNRFVYLKGMSYDKAKPGSYGAIPFWDLPKNKMVLSPCMTAMGVRKVEFSNDLTVAHAETVDTHHSLCSTTEEKSLVRIPGHYTGAADFIFNPATKHLFAKYLETNDEDYQELLKMPGQDMRHVTFYQSPVPKDSDNPESNDVFATALLGTPPNHRFLVAKSRGARLNLSLWDYTKQQAAPKKTYQHEHLIPELDSNIKPVADHRLAMSPDGKKVVLLSKSGVITVFDIASGQLLWKKQLPPQRTEEGYTNYSLSFRSLKATQGLPVPPLLLEQKEPQTLRLFNWQTGQQRQLALPNTFTHSYKQYGEYLVYAQITGNQGQLLLFNWQSGQQRVVQLPAEFKDTWWVRLVPESQQLVFKSTNTVLKPPYSMLLLDLSSGKYRVLTTPYPDDRHYTYDQLPFADFEHYPSSVRLTHGYHSIQRGKHLNTENEMQHSFDLYDMNNRQSQILQMTDLFMYSKIVKAGGKPPEFHTIAYDKQKKQAQYCRLQLQHTH